MRFFKPKRNPNALMLFLLLGFIIVTSRTNAQNTHEDGVNLDKIPPRIIRACCTFGYDMKLWGVPFVSIDQVIDIDDLNAHHFMGKSSEGIGTIYTQKGGFIDIAHVRDQIDWTRYVYAAILNAKGKGEVILTLRNEAGRKRLSLNVPLNFTNDDCILLAGKITYDFSLWHEIATWFGASTIPFISEKFSSFSVEDVYSNLLGVHIGMKTLHSKLPFNEAATNNIRAALDSLVVVKTKNETYKAYDAINNVWYTNKKRIPSNKITLKRDTDVLLKTRPWIAPNQENNYDSIILEVPLLNSQGDKLTDFYEFSIDLNNKIPLEKIFPNKESRVVNQNDFTVLLESIANEVKVSGEHTFVEKE